MKITQKAVFDFFEPKLQNLPRPEVQYYQKKTKNIQDPKKYNNGLFRNPVIDTSNLNIDIVPKKYNLKSVLFEKVNNTDFKKYNPKELQRPNIITDNVELIDYKLNQIVNLSQFNIDNLPQFLNTSISNLATNINLSQLNIDNLPQVYSQAQYLKSIVNSSQLNIDYLPPMFSSSGVYQPHYLDTIVNLSQFNIDYVPTNYTVSGFLTSQFASNYAINGTPFMYSPSGVGSPQFLGLPNVFNTSLLNIDNLPVPYNQQQFLSVIVNNSFYNIDNLPQNYIPSLVSSGLQSLFVWQGSVPTTSNYFGDSAATGFTAYQTTSDFVGINGTEYQYPLTINPQHYPTSQNFFNDLENGAVGFTTFMYYQGIKKPSQFLGINNDTYIYPQTVTAKQGNLIFDIPNQNGPAFTLNSPLGLGSTISYYNENDVLQNTVFTAGGYTNTNRYENSETNRLGTIVIGKGVLDGMYKTKKYDEMYNNSTFIKQPFIKRLIGERWGHNIPDMFIRGGYQTALTRTEKDVERISMFLATPRGLMWQALQLGLGQMNPKVNSFNGEITRTTRQHFGASVLKTIPLVAFGGHANKHGLIEPDLGRYSFVAKYKPSRLIELQAEIFESLPQIGGIITSLSGRGGAQSTLGIGETVIRRYEDTRTQAKKMALDYDFKQIWSFENLYAMGQTAKFKNENYFGIAYDTFEEREISLKQKTIKAIDNNTDKNPYNPNIQDSVSRKLIDNKTFSDKQLVGNLRAKTKHETDVNKDTLHVDSQGYDNRSQGLKDKVITHNLRGTPGSNIQLENATQREITGYPTTNPETPAGDNSINNYVVMGYNQIPTKDDRNSKYLDFRDRIQGVKGKSLTDIEKAVIGKNEIMSGGKENGYYNDNNLEQRYGFSKSVTNNQTNINLNPYEFLEPSNTFKSRLQLTKNEEFRGDKVTAIDIGNVSYENIYPHKAEDLIQFYFEDAQQGLNVMPFRCTMTGFTDTFSPGWTGKEILGRPDKAYLYDSFERQIGFSFKVHAMSRSEMIPMWRKINYLASYTMPDYKKSKGKPSAPFMRITIGHLFQQTPGFINSLSYTIPDEATWDIAEDIKTNIEAKQLPMLVEISIGFTIISDFRPQLMGRVYSLSPQGHSGKIKGQWLETAQI